MTRNITNKKKFHTEIWKGQKGFETNTAQKPRTSSVYQGPTSNTLGNSCPAGSGVPWPSHWSRASYRACHNLLFFIKFGKKCPLSFKDELTRSLWLTIKFTVTTQFSVTHQLICQFWQNYTLMSDKITRWHIISSRSTVKFSVTSFITNRGGIWLDADLVCLSWNCGDCLGLLCFFFCLFFLGWRRVKHPYLKIWSSYFCFFPISFVDTKPQVIVVVPCSYQSSALCRNSLKTACLSLEAVPWNTLHSFC